MKHRDIEKKGKERERCYQRETNGKVDGGWILQVKGGITVDARIKNRYVSAANR